MYHAKGLDAPTKLAQTLEVRKVNARYRSGSQNMDGGSVNNRILTLVRRTHALVIGTSLSNQEIHKDTRVPRGGVYGGFVILAHPRLMVRECTLIFEPSRG